MYLSIPADTTSKIIQVPIFDSSSTIGAMLTGLVYNSASLTAYYNREGAAGAATAITLVTATKGTWTSSGFVAADGTNTPGWYELHVPDAALAAGAKSVSIHLKGATNMVPVPILVELTAVSNQDAVRGGMTALPASGTLAVNPVLAATQTGVTIPTVTTVTNAPSDSTGTTTLLSRVVGTLATGTHQPQSGDAFARLGAPAGASTAADVAAVKAETAVIVGQTGTTGVIISQAQADKVWSTAARSLTDKAGFALSAAGVQAIWDALTSAFITVGSIGKKLADWVVGSLNANQSAVTIGTVTTLTNAPTNMAKDSTVAKEATVASLPTLAGIEASTVLAKEASLGTAQTGDLYGLVTGADTQLSTVPTTTSSIVNKIKYVFEYFRNKRAVSLTTETLYREDAITTLGTAPLSDDGTTRTKGEMS